MVQNARTWYRMLQNVAHIEQATYTQRLQE